MATITICGICKKEKLMVLDNEPLCKECLSIAINRAREDFEGSLTEEQLELRKRHLKLCALL